MMKELSGGEIYVKQNQPKSSVNGWLQAALTNVPGMGNNPEILMCKSGELFFPQIG